MNDKLQLWGGVECTVNRIQDQYFDQCKRSGHYNRLSDLDLIAELGIKTLRYPVIWERIAPNGLDKADWSWADERLGRLRDLHIEPIVGLIHHGSGPQDTNLLDPEFPPKFAEFARAVAKRYPWLRKFTPVNEPLTTARFSALYGLWYPHHTSDESFWRALLNECRATVEAMRVIREIIPDAELITTEDLGKTYSTPKLRYQAEFENERRWLSIDLISGRQLSTVMVNHASQSNVSQKELNWFRQNAGMPSVIGLNHYVTSERYLDERIELYPEWAHGGNGRDLYADVHVTRVNVEFDNIHGLLRDAWERYGQPLAITEAHLGDVPEEQQRWLWERWTAAEAARAEGINVVAVTVWALFGSFDWNSLLVRFEDFYEPGVFHINEGIPRPTPLSQLVRALANSGEPDCHSVLAEPGWWCRDERVFWRAS